MEQFRRPLYIFTGTGRCGTGYIARLLTAAGMPCGHEKIYTSNGPNRRASWEAHADSSWLAAPFEPLDRGAKFWIARNPFDVARSMAGIEWPEHPKHEPYRAYAALMLGIRFIDHLTAAQFMSEWWMMYGCPQVRVEHAGELRAMMLRIGIDKSEALAALAEVPTDVNARARNDAYLESASQSDLRLLEGLAKEWGY